MPKRKKILLSSMDVGDWAQHYASRPYGHHKAEVYELFVDIISCLPDSARVLDIGAGPGHLACEFYQRCRNSRLQFVLLDASVEMLRLAEQRLTDQSVRTVHRSFNMDGWDKGMGRFAAIVSNNALFHVRSENLRSFYGSCFGLLEADGFLLSQQSFAWEDGVTPYESCGFSAFMQRLPEPIMSSLPHLSERDRERLDREKAEASEQHARALDEAKAAGVEFMPGQTGYQFLTVEAHLEAMREAGFAAGCIWRKREFAVLCGVRGEPL